MNELKKLPGIDTLLNLPETKELIKKYGKELIAFSIRKTIDRYREEIKKGAEAPSIEGVIRGTCAEAAEIADGSLKPVVNATGIILHTNLGRYPFGKDVFNDVAELLKGYCNLEFDLKKGVRSDRNYHASKLLKYITGAEDILIVNNNAAAVVLVLKSFAKDKQVIISRGELVEIGGSFRIPEIMETSGCKMVEIGATNKTKVSDYENAINEDTALLLKVHKSNYSIKGFTEEVSLEELVKLGKKYKIPVIYDIGSGLLRKPDRADMKDEPDVKKALSAGIDLITFSGDKLLGGPQAGIIAGKKGMIEFLKKDPMMRALRVCKLTIALLQKACQYYLNNELLDEKNLIFKITGKTEKELKANAQNLQQEFKKYNIESKIERSKGQFGGGTLPDLSINSYSVVIAPKMESNKQKSAFAKKMHTGLLNLEKPVLGVLKNAEISFDVLTLFDDEIRYVAKAINNLLSGSKPLSR